MRERMISRLGANTSPDTTTHSVSMPVGRCSKDTQFSSNACKTLRPKPSSLFIIAFSMLMTEKPLRPAMPVMVGCKSSCGAFRLIIVPGCDGSLVLRMLVGIPALCTGNMASSCRTDAPI